MHSKLSRFIKYMLIVLFFALFIAAISAVIINYLYPRDYMDLVNRYSQEFDVDPALVLSVIRAESSFRSEAVSRAGARGLMQLMKPTAYWLAPQIGIYDFYHDMLFDPAVNIRLGTYYLSMQLDRFTYTEVALAAYNAGSGNVRSWLENSDYSSDGVTLKYIPFSETRNYVNRVIGNMRIYSVLIRLSPTL